MITSANGRPGRPRKDAKIKRNERGNRREGWYNDIETFLGQTNGRSPSRNQGRSRYQENTPGKVLVQVNRRLTGRTDARLTSAIRQNPPVRFQCPYYCAGQRFQGPPRRSKTAAVPFGSEAIMHTFGAQYPENGFCEFRVNSGDTINSVRHASCCGPVSAQPSRSACTQSRHTLLARRAIHGA